MNEELEEDPFLDNADIIRAMEDAPPRGDIPLPEHVLFALERSRREAMGVVVAPVPTKRQGPAAGNSSFLLRAVAVLVLIGAVTYFMLPKGPPTAQITLTSPVGTTGETQPVIAWESRDKPGQKYDVWILPPEGDYLQAPTLFKAEKVTSPVSFASLKPGQDVAENALKADSEYRVLICLADMGRTAGVPVTFKVK